MGVSVRLSGNTRVHLPFLVTLPAMAILAAIWLVIAAGYLIWYLFYAVYWLIARLVQNAPKLANVLDRTGKRLSSTKGDGKDMNKTKLALAALALGALATACTSQAGGHVATGTTSVPQAAATTSTPAPVPSPDGTYRGSCDYTLSSKLYGKDHLIGEVDLHNTGNVGTTVKVKITWPQEGYAPIKRTKTVKTNPGQRKAVRFVVAVSGQGNVIDLLQSWQEHHGMKDGCTYDATMISTFGSPQP